jgi:hypothetical protein
VPHLFETRGWINGSMYAPKKEVSGILPILEEIIFKSAMQPMMPEPPVKKVVLGIASRYKICCYVHPYCCRETIVFEALCFPLWFVD